jgi:hypothetical protein
MHIGSDRMRVINAGGSDFAELSLERRGGRPASSEPKLDFKAALLRGAPIELFTLFYLDKISRSLN